MNTKPLTTLGFTIALLTFGPGALAETPSETDSNPVFRVESGTHPSGFPMTCEGVQLGISYDLEHRAFVKCLSKGYTKANLVRNTYGACDCTAYGYDCASYVTGYYQCSNKNPELIKKVRSTRWHVAKPYFCNQFGGKSWDKRVYPLLDGDAYDDCFNETGSGNYSTIDSFTFCSNAGILYYACNGK